MNSQPQTEVKELIVVAENNGLQLNKVEFLPASFTTHFREAKELVKNAQGIAVTDESQVDQVEKAKESRRALKQVRLEVDKTRIELKEQSLREGRAIDGMANIIKALIVPVEEYLEKQEKFVEIKKAEREEAVFQERVTKLQPYIEDLNVYNIKDMSEYAFDKLFESSKLAFEAQKRVEQQAEEERIVKEKEAAEEQKRIREENERLKAEAEQREKEREMDASLQETALEEERKKREEVEAKMKAIKESAEETVRLEEEAKRKALLAPDKVKLVDLASTIDKLVFPNVSSKEAGEIVKKAENYLSEVSKFIREKAKTL